MMIKGFQPICFMLLLAFLLGQGLCSAALLRHYPLDIDYTDVAGGEDGTLLDEIPLGNSGLTTHAGSFAVGSGAMEFSTDRDFIDVPAHTFSSGSPYSIAFWAKKDGTNLTWDMVIGQRSGTTFFIALHPTIGLRWRSSDSSDRRQSDFAVPHDAEWHHYAITAGADGSLRCYFDGALFGLETNVLTGFIFDTVGEAFPASSDFNFEGQIDEVRIYDERIDDATVLSLYQAGSIDITLGYQRYYPFDVDYLDHGGTNHGVLVDVDTTGNSGITTNEADRVVGAGALNLSADRDFIDVPSVTFGSGTPYSFAFWAKKAAGDTGDAALWDMAIGQRGGTTFFIGLNNGSGLRWRSASSASNRQVDFNAPDDTAWHHHAMTAGADGTLRYFLDGQFVGVATNLMTGFIFDTIGEAYSDARDFDFHGQLDEVYLYDREISSNVVQALYAKGTVEPPAPVDYDVYLIAGQSNADGRGVTAELTGALSSWTAAQSDVRMYYVNPINENPSNPTYQTGWTTLQPGWAAAPGFSGALPSPHFGFELSFARTVADQFPERRVALIKVSKGGTSVETHWHPGASGNFMWQTFTNFLPQALQTLTNAQDTVRVKGMIWHQGESDGSNPNFATDLQAFIAAVRTQVADPAFPMVLGELESQVTDPDTDRSYQNTEMAAVSAADGFTGLASSAGLPTRDEVHFDTPSVIDMGFRYAALVLNVDGDALPDEWERTFLGSITNSSGGVNEDIDGDGLSDLGEFRAGTHPNDAADVLRIIQPQRLPGGRELHWPSRSNRVYRLLHRSDMAASWAVLRDNIAATPPENIEALSDTLNPTDLYRIELLSP